MSILRCEIHDIPWDSDAREYCPACEKEMGSKEDGLLARERGADVGNGGEERLGELQNPLPGYLHWITWETVARCEAQAKKNHNQDLEQLAAGGGLTYLEMLAVLVGCTDYPCNPEDAPGVLETLLADPVEVPR